MRKNLRYFVLLFSMVSPLLAAATNFGDQVARCMVGKGVGNAEPGSPRFEELMNLCTKEVERERQSAAAQSAVNDAIALAAAAKYKKCTTAAAMILDDNVSDATTIAKAAENQCETQLEGATVGIDSSKKVELLARVKEGFFPGIVETILANRLRVRSQNKPRNDASSPKAPAARPST